MIADILLCNIKSETILMKSLYSFTFKSVGLSSTLSGYFYQCMILKHHTLLIWKIGSPSYAALPNVFPFHFAISKDCIC